MKIEFEITQHGYTYRDAISLPDDHTLTEEQINDLKQARFDAWYEYVINPPEPPR
jgi:hypothetical protein